MPRSLGALVSAFALALAVALPAAGDPVDPNFLSTLRGVDPEPSGLDVKVVNLGDELQVTNKTRKTLVVPGYSGEPYLRFLANGTVEENQNSPAAYLNDDRFGTKKLPANADEKAKPDWKVVARNGKFEWHDHRIHYMGRGTPPQVKDEGTRTKVFDWNVPMRLGSTPVAATGTLFWIPTPGSGDDGGGGSGAMFLIAGLLVLAAAGAALLLLLRRRRGAPAAAAPGAPAAGAPGEDKPGKTDEDKPGKEAW